MPDIADYLGVKLPTVHTYRIRGQKLRQRQADGEDLAPEQLLVGLPPEDAMMGRTPVWRPGTIVEWKKRRRGQGRGGGRPRKASAG